MGNRQSRHRRSGVSAVATAVDQYLRFEVILLVWWIPKALGFWSESKCMCSLHDLGTVCMVTCDRIALWFFDNYYMPWALGRGAFYDRCFSLDFRMRLRPGC